MSQKIKNIAKNSISEKIGIKISDILISINNHRINDIIDYKFYQSDENLRIKIKRNDSQKIFTIQKVYSENLGLELCEMKVRKCNCNCIFCFVDQMHPSARPSLKIKDDDFRLSFLYGNFITLTNLRKMDYQRIIEQKISPLYVSVHTINENLRKKIMRYKSEINIKKKLKFLAKNGIQMHTQIVLIPEWNDGIELKKTLFELAELYPTVQSIAIVPVGLTKFRQNLPNINLVDVNLAKNLIRNSIRWRKKFQKKFGTGLVTLADEFFLMANEQIPEDVYYDDFPQIENGVGMVRKFLSNWEIFSKKLKNYQKSITIITAELMYPIIENLVKKLQINQNIRINILAIENRYFGETITVTGLLSGSDVIKNINANVCGDLILLPKNMFNEDGFTIDDKTISDLKSETGKKFLIL